MSHRQVRGDGFEGKDVARLGIFCRIKEMVIDLAA